MDLELQGSPPSTQQLGHIEMPAAHHINETTALQPTTHVPVDVVTGHTRGREGTITWMGWDGDGDAHVTVMARDGMG